MYNLGFVVLFYVGFGGFRGAFEPLEKKKRPKDPLGTINVSGGEYAFEKRN